MVTASIASFLLGLVMVLVILVSRRFNVNPDNVATPIAASLGEVDDKHHIIVPLGDLTTLGLLSWMASLLWQDLDKVGKIIFLLWIFGMWMSNKIQIKQLKPFHLHIKDKVI